jgi:predicted type IV restriction endonuclease
MAKIASKVVDRISAGLKRFQPILEAARVRDINESDTVVIVTDLLQELFGYEKYSEITSEHAIRGTYCDLAIKLDGRLSLLLEVKAIGLDLKENHVKQAVDYAANQGCDWVILTNGIVWRAHRLSFEKPIQAEQVLELNLCQLSHKRSAEIELLWLLSREGIQKAGLAEYHAQREALSRFTLGALLQTDSVVDPAARAATRVTRCQDRDRRDSSGSRQRGLEA